MKKTLLISLILSSTLFLACATSDSYNEGINEAPPEDKATTSPRLEQQ